MLVQFKVKNFRSIKESEVFTMTCSPRDKHAYSTGHRSAPYVLPVAGIFGSNASGKSNFVLALKFVDELVRKSRNNEREQKIPVTPFLLSRENEKLPSEFEISFIYQDTLYKYGITLSETRIHDEWLFIVPKEGRTNEVFVRSYNEDRNDYDWSINDKLVKGPKLNWRQLTHDQMLFMSIVHHFISENLSSSEANAISNAAKWFSRDIDIMTQDQGLPLTYTAGNYFSDKDDAKKILQHLKRFDVGISNLSIDENDIDEEQIKKVPEKFREAFRLINRFSISAIHLRDENTEIAWDIENESGGTKKLFGLIGVVIEVLAAGTVLVVDELHNNFHPHLLEGLIELFQNRKTNPHNAQLIFTSHDVTAMNPSVLSSEQIWFTQKNKKTHSTEIVPLSDYKPRGDSFFWKHYLAGRYNAIPDIGSVDDLL